MPKPVMWSLCSWVTTRRSTWRLPSISGSKRLEIVDRRRQIVGAAQRAAVDEDVEVAAVLVRLGDAAIDAVAEADVEQPDQKLICHCRSPVSSCSRIAADREMRRQLEADRAVDRAGRRTAARHARAGRARRRSSRRSSRPRRVPRSCREAPCAGVTPSACSALARPSIADAGAAGLARPVDQVAVLVEHHGGAAQHRGAFAGEAAEPLAFEHQLLAPDVLHDDLLGQRPAVACAACWRARSR